MAARTGTGDTPSTAWRRRLQCIGFCGGPKEESSPAMGIPQVELLATADLDGNDNANRAVLLGHCLPSFLQVPGTANPED